MPANSDRIAQIEQMKQLESLVAQHIFTRINLHALARALQMRETRLAHQSIADDAPRYAHFALVGLEFRRRCGAEYFSTIVAGVSVQRNSRGNGSIPKRSNLLEFFLALLKLVARLEFQTKDSFRSQWSGKYRGQGRI